MFTVVAVFGGCYAVLSRPCSATNVLIVFLQSCVGCLLLHGCLMLLDYIDVVFWACFGGFAVLAPHYHR